MKVLMFGWEFPPHISGGLGTACEGLTLALNKAGVEVLLVVPKLYGDEVTPFEMINASAIPIRMTPVRSGVNSYNRAMVPEVDKQNEVGSPMDVGSKVESPDYYSINDQDLPVDQIIAASVDRNVNDLRSQLPAPYLSRFSFERGDRSMSDDGKEHHSWFEYRDRQSSERPIKTIVVRSTLMPYAPPAFYNNVQASGQHMRPEPLPANSGAGSHGRFEASELNEAVEPDHKGNVGEPGSSPKITERIVELDPEAEGRHQEARHSETRYSRGQRFEAKYSAAKDTAPAVSHSFADTAVALSGVPDPEVVSDDEESKATFYPFSGRYDRDLFTEVNRYADVAVEIACTHSFDIIHAHDWMTFEAGLAAKRKSGKRLVLHVHATEADRSGAYPDPRIFALEQRGLQLADHIIAVSNWTKKLLVKYYRIHADKITVVHNGILTVDAPPLKKTGPLRMPIVSFAGRLTYQKGPLYFVEAAFKVMQKFPDVHFVMAGSGDQLTRVIDQVSHLRMDNHFSFTGFLKGKDIERLWSMTSVYVMPSVSEPFGITPLEAIRAGVPVIVSNQAGVSEVMPHAIKVDFWDTDALANAICSMIAYPHLATTLARNARQELKNISWDRAALLVKALYEKAAPL